MDNVGLSLLRILIATALPLPLLVVLEFVVSDCFYANKDPEYLRISEAYEAGYLLIDFIYCFLMAAFLLVVPLLLFSVMLEFVAKSSTSKYLVGLAFGVVFGVLIGGMITAPLTFTSSSYTNEALSYVIGSIGIQLFVVLLVSFLNPKDRSIGLQGPEVGAVDVAAGNPYHPPNARQE